jgi:hypothetical protein
MAAVLYHETQGSAPKKVIDLLKGLAVVFAVCICINLIKNSGSRDSFSNFLLVAFSITVLGVLFTSYKLVMEIKTDGIYVSFPPFLPRTTFYAWSSIEDVYIRQFDPLREYNGWGIKTGLSGFSFTFSGNTGIQLLLKNGDKVLIGTAKPKAVAEVLQQLNRME